MVDEGNSNRDGPSHSRGGCRVVELKLSSAKMLEDSFVGRPDRWWSGAFGQSQELAGSAGCGLRVSNVTVNR